MLIVRLTQSTTQLHGQEWTVRSPDLHQLSCARRNLLRLKTNASSTLNNLQLRKKKNGENTQPPSLNIWIPTTTTRTRKAIERRKQKCKNKKYTHKKHRAKRHQTKKNAPAREAGQKPRGDEPEHGGRSSQHHAPHEKNPRIHDDGASSTVLVRHGAGHQRAKRSSDGKHGDSRGPLSRRVSGKHDRLGSILHHNCGFTTSRQRTGGNKKKRKKQKT